MNHTYELQYKTCEYKPYINPLDVAGPVYYEQRCCVIFRDGKRIATFYEGKEKNDNETMGQDYVNYAKTFLELLKQMDKKL